MIVSVKHCLKERDIQFGPCGDGYDAKKGLRNWSR